MTYFKDKTGALHFLDDAKFANLLPPGSVQITDAEAQALQAPSLAQSQAQQTGAMYAAYGAACSASVSFTTAGKVTKTFQADDASVATLQAAVIGYQAAGAVPGGFYWMSEDNTQVPFTFADLQGLAAAMLAQGWAAFQRLQARKASIRAATTLAAVQAVVW